MDLNDQFELVHSKETFFEFVEALEKDKLDEDEKEKTIPSSPYGSGANGWENGSIPAFLEAMIAFGKTNKEIQLNWKSFALLLYSGKFHE